MSEHEAGPPKNPFVGPVPLKEEDALYGRERETSDLIDLLVSKRIVLLFSPSGAGKTSLIQAALLPRMEEFRLKPLPIIRLSHRNDAMEPQSNVNRFNLSMMRSLERTQVTQLTDDELGEFTLSGYFRERLAGRDEGKKTFWLLILDQFEEVLTLDGGTSDAKREFLTELGALLAGIDDGRTGDSEEASGSERPPIWALFSMREDRVAELQPFLDLIPTALSYRYRMDLLRPDRALEAIQKPAGEYITSEAAEKLIRELNAVQVLTAEGQSVSQESGFIEPVQLQVVCRGLWNKIVGLEKRPIQAGDIAVSSAKDPGEVDRALADYFNTEVEKVAMSAQVSSRKIRNWIGTQLITANGIRSQALREALLDAAIGHLIDAHLIRSDVRGGREWIELAHDRLVNPIRAGNEAWELENLEPFQIGARLWAKSGRPSSMLIGGMDLVKAERFSNANPQEVDDAEKSFVVASRDEQMRIARDERNRKRVRAIAVVAVFIIGAFFSLFGLVLVEYFKQAKWSLITLKQQEDQVNALKDQARTKNYQILADIREMPTIQAIGELKKAKLPSDDQNLNHYFDNTAIRVLGNIAGPVTRILGEHRHIVRSLIFSDNGSTLLSGSWDGTIAMWNTGSSQGPVSSTGNQLAQTYTIAITRTEDLVASTYIDGRIILWRATKMGLEKLQDMAPAVTGYSQQVTTAEFNYDGNLLATAGWDKVIKLWNVSDPEAPLLYASFGSKYHTAPIERIKFLPSNNGAQRLVSVDLDGKIAVWRVTTALAGGTPKIEKELDFGVKGIVGKDVGLYCAAVSPDGRFLVAADSKGYDYLWDLSSGAGHIKGIRLTEGRHGVDYDHTVYDIAFSPDGKEFASAGVDGTILRWKLPAIEKALRDSTDIPYERFGPFGEKLYSLAYDSSHDGVVAVGGTRTVYLTDFERRHSLLASALKPDAQSPGPWTSVSMNRSSSTIAATVDKRHIFLWRHSDRQVAPVAGWTIDAASEVAFALQADGFNLMTVNCGGSLTNWNLTQGESPVPGVVVSRPNDQGSCSLAAPAFSSDGKYFAVGIDKQLEVFAERTAGWESLGSLKFSPTEKIGSLAFSEVLSSDGAELLAVAGITGTIRLLDVSASQQLLAFRSGTVTAGSPVQSLAFASTPTGEEELVSAGADGLVTQWQLPSLVPKVFAMRSERTVTSIVYGSSVNPVLIMADREGSVRAWSGHETVPIAPVSHHPVHSLALSADGRFLVTAGDELLAWDLSRDAIMNAAARFVEPASGTR